MTISARHINTMCNYDAMMTKQWAPFSPPDNFDSSRVITTNVLFSSSRALWRAARSASRGRGDSSRSVMLEASVDSEPATTAPPPHSADLRGRQGSRPDGRCLSAIETRSGHRKRVAGGCMSGMEADSPPMAIRSRHRRLVSGISGGRHVVVVLSSGRDQ